MLEYLHFVNIYAGFTVASHPNDRSEQLFCHKQTGEYYLVAWEYEGYYGYLKWMDIHQVNKIRDNYDDWLKSTGYFEGDYHICAMIDR